MEKILLTLAITVIGYSGYAQTNALPTSGNVGIGTTSPRTRLEIAPPSGNAPAAIFRLYGNTSWGHVLTLSTDGTYGNDDPRLLFSYHGGSKQWAIGGYSNSNRFSVWEDPGDGVFGIGGFGTERLTVAAGGNVGIGTTSPGAKLDISSSNNNIFQITALGSGYGGTVLANIYSERAVVGSDALLKVGSAYAPNTFIVQDSGNVGIGTATPHEALSVNGTIRSKEVKVETTNWPDYVFKPSYALPELTKIKAYINQYHHLPEIPSADEMAKNGLNLGDMNTKLLKKVEELTLYLIEENKAKQEQQKEIELLKQQLATLTKTISQMQQH